MDLRPPVSPFMRMAQDSEQCLYSNIQNVVMPNGKTRDLRIEISGYGKPISVSSHYSLFAVSVYRFVIEHRG